MTEKMMHTPTPWTFETVKTSIGHCHKIMPIGACLYVDHRDPREGLDPKTATARANAELIVRAANSHDALVKALEGIDTFAWSAMSADCEDARIECQKRIDAARAAIRAARGEP